MIKQHVSILSKHVIALFSPPANAIVRHCVKTKVLSTSTGRKHQLVDPRSTVADDEMTLHVGAKLVSDEEMECRRM